MSVATYVGLTNPQRRIYEIFAAQAAPDCTEACAPLVTGIPGDDGEGMWLIVRHGDLGACYAIERDLPPHQGIDPGWGAAVVKLAAEVSERAHRGAGTDEQCAETILR